MEITIYFWFKCNWGYNGGKRNLVYLRYIFLMISTLDPATPSSFFDIPEDTAALINIISGK